MTSFACGWRRGAHYNTTPPNQVPLYPAQSLHPAFPSISGVKQLAQGQMMIGPVSVIFLTGWVGRVFYAFPWLRVGLH